MIGDAGSGVGHELDAVPHVHGHVHDLLGVVLAALRSAGYTNEAILYGLNLRY